MADLSLSLTGEQAGLTSIKDKRPASSPDRLTFTRISSRTTQCSAITWHVH